MACCPFHHQKTPSLVRMHPQQTVLSLLWLWREMEMRLSFVMQYDQLRFSMPWKI